MSGAWLNHTAKEMKKAIQLRCRMRMLPLKDKRLNFSRIGISGSKDMALQAQQ